VRVKPTWADWLCRQVEVMHDLVELDLRKNQIPELIGELIACTNLVKLHLGDNKVGT
jgi:Leucine-rich repeat (LRR) protein